MREPRWPWLLAAALLLASAMAVIWSTYLHWLPCRGSMLSATILHGYAYGPDFSDACRRRMDAGAPFPYPPEPAARTPWAAELGVAATGLAGLAWLTLMLGQRWSARAKAVAALPGLATIAAAAVGSAALGEANPGPLDYLYDYLAGWLWLSIDGAAVLAAIVILTREPEVRGRSLLRLLLALWGCTAFSAVHGGFEYGIMITFSDANWDSPPGTGYLTGAVLIISGLLTLISTPTRARVGAAVAAVRPDTAGQPV
jgi:hypothetical protein